MFRLKDLVLIGMAVTGILGGVFMPKLAGFFTPAVLYLMMTLLFLAFLNVDYFSLLQLDRKDLQEVVLWTVLKLLVLPVGLWGIARLLAPDYALPVLVLSGVSTGVTAPFFATHLGANINRVLKLVMFTSLLVPFTLPFLVSWLMDGEMKISAVDMSLMLLKVIFIPLGAALLVKKTMPGVIIHFNRIAFPLSLTIFLLINLGIFSRYSEFLKAHQDQLAASVGVACLCALAYVLIAMLVALLSKWRMDGLTGAVSLLYVNNVLAVVFGGQFFGPKTPLLAAVYMLPVFLMVLPMRMLSGLNLETQAK